MLIAVPYENGQIFQHFGHTDMFMLYLVSGGKIIKTKELPASGGGHGALGALLSQNLVDAVICGGIGGGAQNALQSVGIQLYAGVSGDVETAVLSLANGNLTFSSDATCTCDHEHEHEHH